MNVLFFYFSGTGHTKYLAKKLQSEFDEQGVDTTVCDVTGFRQGKVFEYDFNKFDIIGFGYPIHAFSAPKNFELFVKNLNISGKEYFILKNSREALKINDSSSRKIVKTLKKKNCKLIREIHLLMPYNIHFRHDDRLVKQMLNAVDEKLPDLVKEIIEKRYKKLRFKVIPSLFEIIVGGTEKTGAKLIGKSFKPDDGCISCGKCADFCPVSNVSMTAKDDKIVPSFGKKCMLCMRCVMNCPTKSIKIGKFLRGWEVYGRYDFDEISRNDSITADFITKNYKGAMARSYKRYFKINR